MMMKQALVEMVTTSLALWALIGDAKAAITFTTPSSKPSGSTVNVGTANQITTNASGYGLSITSVPFKTAKVDLDWTGGGVSGFDVLLTAGQTLGLAWNYSGNTDLTYSPSTFINGSVQITFTLNTDAGPLVLNHSSGGMTLSPSTTTSYASAGSTSITVPSTTNVTGYTIEALSSWDTSGTTGGGVWFYVNSLAFTISGVPEPSGALLVAVGAGLTVCRRRRNWQIGR